MYPYDVFLGMDLYEILLVLGFLAALIYFRFWADRIRFGARLQNLCIFGAMFAISTNSLNALVALAISPPSEC